MLPAADAELSSDQRQAWNAVDHYLVTESLEVPLFFAHDSALVRRVQEASRHPSFFDEIELSVTGPVEHALVRDSKIGSFHGWLQGISSAGDLLQLPTVAIMAHYDSIGAAVRLATGANSNGSGITALLELARIFSSIYHQPRNRVAVNFLFVATGGSILNHAGTELWMQHMDKQVIDRIDFALCLDSLASSESLHLHFSRPAKTEKIRAVYKLFSDSAAALNIDLTLNRRKVNISSTNVFFAHEILARKHVFAMTLSGHSEPRFRSSSLDSVQSVNITILMRNINFVAEVLFKHSFGFNHPSVGLFNSGPLAVERESVSEWIRILSSSSRAEFLLDKDAPSLNLIRNRLTDYTEHFVNRTYAMDSSVFRESPRGQLMLNANLVRSPFFHLAIFVVVIAYLVAILAGLEYWTKGVVTREILMNSLGLAAK